MFRFGLLSCLLLNELFRQSFTIYTDYSISNIISHLLNEAARCGLHNRNLGNVVMDVFIYFIISYNGVFSSKPGVSYFIH